MGICVIPGDFLSFFLLLLPFFFLFYFLFFIFFRGGGGGEGYTIKLLKESFPSIRPIRTLSDPRSPKLGASIE